MVKKVKETEKETMSRYLDEWKEATSAAQRSYDAFERIPEEKRERIVMTALKEFSEKEYSAASTNAIAKNAGVSKGILFRYFGDKAGLFLYLISWCDKQILLAAASDHALDGNDVIDVVLSSLQSKMRAAKRRPLETAFYVKAFQTDVPPEIRRFLEVRIEASMQIMKRIEEGFDESKLKAGYSKSQVMNVINWVVEGLTREFIESPAMAFGDYESIRAEVEAYMLLLRKMFFKK